MSTIPRSQNHLAALMGLSKAAVSRNVSQGMPINSLEDALAWRQARQSIARRKPAPHLGHSGVTPGKTLTGDSGASVETHDAARTRREISEADLSEMRRAEQRGELIRVDAVTSALARVFSMTRDSLLQIPARLAPLLAADTDPASVQNTLHAEIHQSLQHLAGAAAGIEKPEGTAP